MGKLKLKLLITVGIGIFMITPIVPALNSVAKAAIYRGDGGTGSQLASVSNRGFVWSIMSMLNRSDPTAGAVCKTKYTISADDLSSGKIFGDTPNVAIGGVAVASNGYTNCDGGGWVLRLMNLLGYPEGEYGTFLTSALGYTKNTGSDGKITYTGTTKSISWNMVPSYFFKGSQGSRDDDALYWIYFKNFVNGCDASQSVAVADATTDQLDQAKSDNKSYIVWVADGATGNLVEYIYTSPDKNKGDRVTVGYGVGAGDDRQMTCKELADKLHSKNLAQAYADTLKQQGVDGINDSDAQTTSTSSQSQSESCEGGIPAMGWLICPVVDQISRFAGWVDDKLENLLKIDVSEYNKNSGIRTAWSAIRIISTVALLGIALMIIIAQMLNLEIFSAYSLKKMLPRLIAAVIFIQLSWFIGTMFIEIINVIGSAIADLIAAPFGGSAKMGTIAAIMNDYNGNTSGVAQLGAFAFLGGGLAVGFGAIGGGFGLLMIAIVVLLAALTAFITLVLRQVIILGLLIIAPIAIITWILPNTQKWWKSYSDLLIKLVLMFPLVMALLMLGKVFAYIVANSGKTGVSSSVNFFIIILAYFGPFFLIPSMIKASGTIFAKAAGGISMASNKLKSTRPIRRVEEARKHNLEAREYNAKRKGATWATGGGLLGRSRAGKNFGRYWAGTAGGVGAYGEQLRKAEEEQSIKNAQLEYGSAMGGVAFPDQMKNALLVAQSRVGSKASIGGKDVIITEAIRRVAASDLTRGKKADSLRQIQEQLYGVNSSAEDQALYNKMASDNAGDWLKLAPDLAKAAPGKLNGAESFHEFTYADAAGAHGSTWRNMAARAKYLDEIQHGRATDLAGNALSQTELARLSDGTELAKLKDLADHARNDEMLRGSMDAIKDSYAEQIITNNGAYTPAMDSNNQPILDDQGHTTFIDSSGRVMLHNETDPNTGAQIQKGDAGYDKNRLF